MLLPHACPSCGRPGPAPCASCWARLRPAPVSTPPDGLDACLSLLVYEHEARELIARLKYRNARSALAWLAEGMAGLVVASAVAESADRDVDVVTWAPTTRERRRRRGFDQAELLARTVARRLELPVRRLVERTSTSPQTGRAGAERRRGPTFEVVARVGGAQVLIVDDVTTTGATLGAAARALRAAGARRVTAVTAGRTPLKVVAAGADA